ncbi:MAG: hypothetical protein H0U19_02565 [Acidobacteria bacterium]|nr:hypothetical protein [Acidobacteriota bacterium]
MKRFLGDVEVAEQADQRGQHASRIRDALGDGYRLAWLPDSRRVVVVDRGSRIHLVDTQTGRQRTLLEGSPWRFWGNVPPIAPDGRTIYLGALQTQSDIWMIAR